MSCKGRINIYRCPDGHNTVTIDRDDGTTPFMMRCLQKDNDGKHNCTKHATSGRPIVKENSLTMKLKDQVCTLEQGIKLKQLGVAIMSVFVHVQNAALGYEGIKFSKDKTGPKDGGVITYYPAFTSAELGKILPAYTVSKYVDRLGHWQTSLYFQDLEIFEIGATEAEARAAMLIRLLSNPKYGYSAKDVNEALFSDA